MTAHEDPSHQRGGSVPPETDWGAVAFGTAVFTLFLAGHGAAWIGYIFGGSYTFGAAWGALMGLLMGVAAGTRFAYRFIPLGILQEIYEIRTRGEPRQIPMSKRELLAYRGLASALVPVLLTTLLAMVIAGIVKAV